MNQKNWPSEEEVRLDTIARVKREARLDPSVLMSIRGNIAATRALPDWITAPQLTITTALSSAELALVTKKKVDDKIVNPSAYASTKLSRDGGMGPTSQPFSASEDWIRDQWAA